tara:strand:- start:499 stop:642 length:144 start_codon:yes stop_codon:yes gene_type:complete
VAATVGIEPLALTQQPVQPTLVVVAEAGTTEHKIASLTLEGLEVPVL